MENLRKILLIDDEPDFVDAFTKTLVAKSYQVIPSSRAEVEERMKEVPDMIILGTFAPSGEAFRLHQWLKGHPRYKDIPLLVIDAPLEGFRFGGSIYNGQGEVEFSDEVFSELIDFAGRYNTYNLSAEYATDVLSIRAEYVPNQKMEGGDEIKMVGYYIEAAYLFREQFQVAVLYNNQDTLELF